jgi:hypothetical protein
MTQQTTFPPEPHVTTPEYKRWDRFEQLDFLQQTTTQEFQSGLLDMIVRSMSDDEFQETFEYITRMNGLARDYQELDRMSQIPQ